VTAVKGLNEIDKLAHIENYVLIG